MNAHRNGTPMLASSGYVAQVDADRVSQSRIKRLRGLSQPQCRLRIEEFRVFYDVTDDAVEVLAVVPQSGTSAWLEEMGKAEG